MHSRLCSLGVLLVISLVFGVAGCSDDRNVRGRALADGGVDASKDAGPDANDASSDDAAVDATDDAAARDIGSDVASDTGPDTADASGEDAAADAATDSTDAQPDAEPDATIDACSNGDGACPSGCYVTNDDDCELDCRDPASWPPSWTAFEDEVLRLTNVERANGATCGGTAYPAVPALGADAKLREAARCHSLDMAVNDFFDHTGSNGSNAGERITQAGYQWSYWAENISTGRPTPADVVDAWMNSEGHCKNIMRSSSEELGVGYVFDDPDAYHNYKHYWTQAFGRPR